MAHHYDTAVIPARIRAPKDKATVENSVGIISTWILAVIRNQQFLSLKELNGAIKENLEKFNHKPFQKKEGSRVSLFMEEKHFLMPLPKREFELATWKISTVQYNYHISIDKQNYSVPYEYIKQKVDVRITKSVYTVKYIRIPDLLSELAIARGEGTYRKVIKQYKTVKLLILDEWLLFPLKESEARDLLEIVEARYKKSSTIFCSQF